MSHQAKSTTTKQWIRDGKGEGGGWKNATNIYNFKQPGVGRETFTGRRLNVTFFLLLIGIEIVCNGNNKKMYTGGIMLTNKLQILFYISV